jgi:hypothetical protein
MIRQVMAWRATGPGDVTLLTAPRRVITKTITPDRVRGYDRVTAFSVAAVRVDSVEDLAELLLARLADDPHTCVIRGALRSRCR